MITGNVRRQTFKRSHASPLVHPGATKEVTRNLLHGVFRQQNIIAQSEIKRACNTGRRAQTVGRDHATSQVARISTAILRGAAKWLINW
jgi:hypothetical protein